MQQRTTLCHLLKQSVSNMSAAKTSHAPCTLVMLLSDMIYTIFPTEFLYTLSNSIGNQIVVSVLCMDATNQLIYSDFGIGLWTGSFDRK